MRFNFLKKTTKVVTNYEGAKAYAVTPQTELYAAAVTASLSDTFYEKNNNRLERLQRLVAKNDAEYVAKLAVYARTQMNLRSVPLVLAIELAKNNSGNAIVSKAVGGVVKRADEIAELLAYYQAANKREGTKKLNKLSKQVQKGLSNAFNTFDEYQFAKYNRATDVRLRDALFLVHPKAKDEAQQELFNKIAADTLATPYTWETELSALGQAQYTSDKEKAAAVKEKWEELIDSRKMGYMATLRNLRNILTAGVSYKHIVVVCHYLADARAVANSKQLPFRFLAAYRELKELKSDNVSMVLGALEDAIKASAQNIKGFDANTSVLIACDVSGSMQKPVSAKSKVLLYDIGLVLGMMMQSRSKRVMTGMFGDRWKVINMSTRSILANVQEYYRREGEVGYATNGHLVTEDLIARNVRMDKIMLFTDCQLWDNQHVGASLKQAWRQYKAMYPGAQLYLFDLAGYGNSPVDIRQDNVHLIAGWSDKIFDVLQAIEEGGDAVSKINSIVL
jgi:60 kDa SS-A/Ro ribonucleoprotein